MNDIRGGRHTSPAEPSDAPAGEGSAVSSGVPSGAPAGEPSGVLTRRASAPDATVAYGDLPDQVADVRFPRNGAGAAAPLVVIVHGGFWRARYDRAHTGPMADDLAARGFATASVEYRRVGQEGGGWPGTFDDVARAVDAVPALAAGVVPGGIGDVVLLGHSAGGHLALWAASRARLPACAPWRLPAAPPLRGVLALAPVAALELASRQGLSDGAADDLLGGPAGDLPERTALADPLALLPSSIPSVLVHGTADEDVPVGQSRRYADAARAAGDPCARIELPGIGHLALIDPLSGAWPTVLDALTGLLGR
ncbi:alpha/beta hydrolase [Actinoallomurus rhizosphaericola]|uniref:alpha/beta hydrolase n=1 Tax=Actinoallomurus rhizosphaericola TaxID=2952536 RepID=UPI002093226E|nr:alpha/beta hydrolase [Actinoallomurus rhizosphaericola]MCO5995246.1 alpha/beta hydrolase [Actinoallomurus rhizosphaericola]